ncbi:efflux RND transporter permease subunit [Fulvimarina sp. 2208YS6-2-32]|uniref:Efflux RND transporter permease subunit n=1 Tax=Fulvimarina uroteuthidis TaxID=3098149 RepID=A0ABU5I3J7_9HYPH|nr:efflux RND transporter permease subunit [Fulvimarina sp. 2208YS6-2-32]MDY8109389.1 efflux RND transporter permease subunit [Fulvimarina sp. 2208YS6-2-32]
MLSEFSLRRPVFASVMSILIVILGIAGLSRMPIRELPDIDAAEVTVSVDYTGAGPGVVDAEVTTVIEGAISTVAGIDTFTTEAELGGSRTVITFEPSRDIDQATADIRAAVQAIVPDLPEPADEPKVEKNDTEGDPIIRLTLSSDTLSASELTDYAERFVTARLETISGVATAQLSGERLYAVRVWLKPDAMAAQGVTVGDISAALEANNIELPAGQIETGSRNFLLRTETRLASLAEFENLIVARRDGFPIRLGGLADIELGVESDDTLYRANDVTAIGLGILRQSSANTLTISEAVERFVADIRDELPAGTTLEITSDDARFIRNSIAEVLQTLAIAVAVVVGVIFVFLASIRATLVPAVTIPIALLGACAGIAFAGFSVNILTLFALILAIGLVVDDAIVVLENIERRIEGGDEPRKAASEGAREVFFAVMATSATLIAVFLPLSFLEGEIGRLFTEFGMTLAIAVAVSTFVALTLCPVLCAKLLRKGKARNALARGVDGATRWMTSVYRTLLTLALGKPLPVLAIAALLSGMSWSLYQSLPSELTPQEDRGVFFVSVNGSAGAGLDSTDVVVERIEALIEPYRESGAVENVISTVGQYGEAGRAFVVAVMAPWEDRTVTPREIVSLLREDLSDITLADVRAFAPSGLGAGGGGTPFEAVVTAPSFDLVARYSQALVDRLRQRTEIVDVRRDYEVNTPGFDIGIDRERARELGISARAVAETVRAFFASAEVTEYIERDRQYPVILQAPEELRNTVADLRGLNIRTDAGDLVPLDGLVEVTRRASVRAYNRYDRQPSVEISAGLADGTDLQTAIAITDEIAEELPAQMGLSWTGQARQFQETSGGLLTTFGLALLIVYLVLAAQFESFVQPIVILLSVPLAVAGALATLFALGEAINVYSQVGMVMLIGLMAKNGILIVEFANQLRSRGLSVRDAVSEAAAVRLRPILMTVLSTVLGAVPLVLSSGAGAESRLSIGLIIIGGYLVASVLTLFLTPVLYDLLQVDQPEEGADAPVGAGTVA